MTSKNETLVIFALFTLLGMAMPTEGFSKDISPFGMDTSEFQKDYIAKGCPGKPADEYCKDLKEMMKTMSNAGASSACNDPNGDYQKALGEASAACGNIPGPTAKDVNLVSCGFAIEQCDCNDPSLTADDRASDKKCSGISNSEYSPSRTSGAFDTGTKTQDRFRACPALAATDIDKLEKDLKENREKVRALEKKIPELQDAAEEAKSQADEKVSDIKKQMADATTDHNKQLAEAEEKARNEKNQLAQQLLQLDEEISKVDEQIGQLKLARGEAAVKREETITQIELNCHASASAQVNKMQVERLELESNRKLNRGGFSDMLKNIGVSDRKQWQRVAKKYYDWCIQSSPTRKSKESANRIYESALKASDQAENNLEKRKSDIRKRMNKIKNGSGCTGQSDSDGESTDSQMCQASAKMQKDAQQAAEDYNLKMRTLGDQARQAGVSGMRKAMSKEAAVQQARLEIQDETNRLNNLEEYMALKRQYAEGASIDSKEYREARSKYYLLKAQAINLVTCKAKAGEEYNCTDDGTCLNAAKYLDLVGKSPVDVTLIQNGNGRPAAKTSTPPGSKPQQNEATGTRESAH